MSGEIKMNHTSLDHEKNVMLETEESVVGVQRIKFQSLASRSEMMVRYTLRSSKTLQNKS